MNDCVFCLDGMTKSSSGVEPERIVKEYVNWWLLIQRDDKRASTKQAAGLLVAKEHIANVTDVPEVAIIEMMTIIKEAAELLCQKIGTAYAGQETVGFNQGAQAGQTIMHAHVHILPVSEEDPEELKVRGGIGGAFEALRKERLKRNSQK